MEGEEDVTFEPPTALAVARRAMILCGVVCRASIETYEDEDYRLETADRIRNWFTDLDLWPYVESHEQAIIDCEFGEMPPRLRIRGTWLIEGLSILSWALKRRDFPPHDDKVDPIAVTNSLDFLSEDAKSLLTTAHLREAAELQAAREWFYDVHCTLRSFLHYGGNGRLASWIGDYLQVLNIPAECVMCDGSLALDGATGRLRAIARRDLGSGHLREAPRNNLARRGVLHLYRAQR